MTMAAQSQQNLSSNADEPRPALKVRLQKTKLCSYHLRSACKHGSACRFAHSEDEMVRLPDLSKTRMCPDFLAGKCTKPNCPYAHNVDEIRSTNFCYKTTPCMWYAMGRCRNGAQCSFAHGDEDRNPAMNEAPQDKAVKRPQRQQEQILQQQQQQQRAKNKSEPMFIKPETVESMMGRNAPHPKYLPLPSSSWSPMAMQYPMSDMAGLSPDIAAAWNLNGGYPMMPGTGYEAFYNQAMAPAHVPTQAAEEQKVKSLSKYIKTLTRQVRELQNTVNQNMRSDSEQSTLIGDLGPDDGSFSNDSNDSENDLDNAHGKVDMGYNCAIDKLVGA